MPKPNRITVQEGVAMFDQEVELRKRFSVQERERVLPTGRAIIVSSEQLRRLISYTSVLDVIINRQGNMDWIPNVKALGEEINTDLKELLHGRK